jgi:hypothetical protein
MNTNISSIKNSNSKGATAIRKSISIANPTGSSKEFAFSKEQVNARNFFGFNRAGQSQSVSDAILEDLKFRAQDQDLVTKFTNSNENRALKEIAKTSLTSINSSRNINATKNSNLDINPNTFDKINPEKYYGQNKNSNGENFDFERAKRFKIAESKIPSDSKLREQFNNETQANKLWNDVRRNLATGNDAKGLFASDVQLNKALNQSIDKFNSGPQGTNHNFQNAVRNADVLSTVTAFAISKEGIHENGLGNLYETYAKVDNALPDNIINSAYLRAFQEARAKNGGDSIAALEQVKALDNKDHGALDVNSTQVKSFANLVNRDAFKSMAESLNLDAGKLEQNLEKYGGVAGENKFYDISGPMALAAARDLSLLEKDASGKTGFQKLVEQSPKRADGKNHEAHVNFHIRPKGDANTDGTAFLDFSQNGAEALASLQKHIGGLNANPMLANQFSFVFQDENNFKEYAPQILAAMKEAGIDVTKLGLNVEGHGSAENGAMIKSGVHGRDYQGIGQDDSQFMAGLLEHTPDIRQVDVNYDSCFGYFPAKHNAEAINQRAKELGLNMAVTYEGSTQSGLVLAESGGEANMQDRFIENADGTFSASSQRIDDGGTDKQEVLYSQDKQSFNNKMQEIREENE